MSWEFIEDRDEETKAGVWNPTLRKCTHFAGQGKELEKVVKKQESMDEGERATWFPLVTWEVMIKYKHKTYLFPWVSVRLIFMNVVSLQNVSQHDEVMLRRKTWLKLFFMTLSYATVSICCSNQGNMLLRSPREPLWGTDWLTVPPVTSGSTTALEQFPGMCPVSDKYSVGTVAHLFCPTLYARQLCLAWCEISQNCTAVWGSFHFIPLSCSFCVHQASSYSLCLGPLCQGYFSQNICWYLLFRSQTYAIYQAQPKFNR